MLCGSGRILPQHVTRTFFIINLRQLRAKHEQVFLFPCGNDQITHGNKKGKLWLRRVTCKNQ
jgi:hypothetical protein